MPNTHVPAAGEAMPAAEGMPIIGRFSRRALLGAFAAVPAIGLPAAKAESIDDRIRRLSRELSQAMDEWAAAGSNAEGARLWLTRAQS